MRKYSVVFFKAFSKKSYLADPVFISTFSIAKTLNTYFIILQLGIAIGFVVPPMLVANSDDLDLIGHDLQWMFNYVAGLTTVLVILMVLCK